MSRMYSIKIESKQAKEKRKSQGKTKLQIVLGLFLIVLVLVVGGYVVNEFVITNPIIGWELPSIDPKLEQTEGITNTLLVGLDTRKDNPGLMNTDTIIVISIDHNNETVTMISIPRDLWLSYQLPNGNYTSSKINGAYANGEWQQKGKGVETLKGVVESIIGQQIHYYAKVTLTGFVQSIDAIGGVDITIPEYYKDAYPKSELSQELQTSCANYFHDGEYCLFEFQAGTEHMSGERALIYARSRLLSGRGDYDRAERQQRVINAFKNKVLSSDTLLDPLKLLELYNIVQENVETSKFSNNDIRAALALKDEFDPNNIGQAVLDPNFGHKPNGYISTSTQFYQTRGSHIVIASDSFEDIQQALEYIRKYPLVYNEDPLISIYNATGNSTLEEDYTTEILEENKLIRIKHTNQTIQNPDNLYSGISIYKFTDKEMPGTEAFLKQMFNIDVIITDPGDGTKALGSEDFVIIIGPQESVPDQETTDTPET